MTIEHEELSKLVPQKGKMFLLGRITDAQPEKWTIESETEITPDFMFYEKNIDGCPTYVCFELIAQTIAALTGLNAQKASNSSKMGFILSVSNLHFDFDIIKSGESVRVKSTREDVDDNIFSFSAEIFVDGKFGGKGKLTVMEVENKGISKKSPKASF